MTPEQLIGMYLRNLRLSRGWTLDDLAKKTGLGNSSLSYIENGKRGISIKVLCRLAVAFDVSACTILHKSGYIERVETDLKYIKII